MKTIWAVLLVCLATGCASPNRPVQLLSGAGPVYPPAAKAAGTEGVVVVRYGIAADGRVVGARVNGEPVAVDNVVSRVRFKLDDDDAYDRY